MLGLLVYSHSCFDCHQLTSGFKFFRNFCLPFLTNCELFEGLTGFYSFLYVHTLFPELEWLAASLCAENAFQGACLKGQSLPKGAESCWGWIPLHPRVLGHLPGRAAEAAAVSAFPGAMATRVLKLVTRRVCTICCFRGWGLQGHLLSA